jgi:hypothetical protein
MPKTATMPVTNYMPKTTRPKTVSANNEALSQEEYNMRLYDCPLDHTPNAETLAAMQEVQDMIDGKIPHKTFSSFDEFWADLNSDD